MSNEATSSLSFQDLLAEVAYKLGIAFYGPNGDQKAQVPIDAHDLDLCKRLVNKGIRMFIHDAPAPNGWRWAKPVAQVDLWPTIGISSHILTAVYVLATNRTTIVSSTPVFNAQSPGATLTSEGDDYVIDEYISGTSVTLIGDASSHVADSFIVIGTTSVLNPLTAATFSSTTGRTTIVATVDPSFYPSMELKTITIAGTDYTIINYVGPKVVEVAGDASSHVGDEWAMVSTGDFTLPANFGGQFSGQITFITSTNRGMTLHWVDESTIRVRRQNFNIETGTPYQVAVRLMPTPSLPDDYTAPRRRWELMTWRMPSENLAVLFPYVLAFDSLVELTEYSPAPIGHDETVKAAILAVAEKETEDTINGPDWSYYRNTCLPNSFRVDAMSAPKAIGYFGNPTAAISMRHPIVDFRNRWYQRPEVEVF